MGNIQNCQNNIPLPNNSQIIASKYQSVNTLIQTQYSQQITNQLKPYIQQSPPKKVQFFYIKPIVPRFMSNSEQTIIFDDITMEKQKLFKKQQIAEEQKIVEETVEKHRSSQSTNIEGQNDDEKENVKTIENQFNKISVQWNSFVKIKHKSYLEDYIFIKEIGKGAYGAVCKIKMKYGGLMRAAKIIKAAVLTSKKDIQQKFLAQISIPMALDHPNLIKLFEVFQWKKQFVLVMQLCEGGDLFHRIKESKLFNEKKAAEIMKQVLSAVFYMHKKGIMHRDLKPENMLYDTENKSLKIIDFGTAQKFVKGNIYKSLVGTPYYIAPQVIKGEYDERCDVWSCGIILFVMLSGYPPFNGKSQQQIMNKIRMQPLEFNNIIWSKRSSKAKQLITKMLAKRPEDRLTAEQALNSEWILNTPNQINQTQIGTDVCNNLKSFHFQNKLKAVVYTYIASQLYSNKDKEILLRAFRQMDKDGDGVIGKQQLMRVFSQNSKTSLSQLQIEKILNLVDTNGSGLIDFTEFLVAASNQQKILQRERLENAFNYLDTDHSGYISIEEVKAFLDGSEQTGEEIKKIFNEVDQNGDGTISKKQFLSLLLKKQV